MPAPQIDPSSGPDVTGFRFRFVDHASGPIFRVIDQLDDLEEQLRHPPCATKKGGG